MPDTPPPSFEDPGLLSVLEACSDAALDDIETFGVIGFDAHTVVRRYSAWESRAAGLPRDRVVGLDLFGVVAQCMNNYLVAQRFEDAEATGTALDAIVDYVLTLRMKPQPVRLRLLARPGGATRYVLVERQRQSHHG